MSAAQAAAAPPPPAAAPAPVAPAPAAAPAPEPAGEAPPAYLAEIEQLSSLHEAGILSDDEFEAKKRQVLGL